MCDMAHTAGLIAAKQLTSPFDHCHIVTTTTHKTLRGPRGALIFSRKQFSKQIDKAVFPGCQGGPHNHSIAGIAVALFEAAQPDFKQYAKQVCANAKRLAAELTSRGFKIVSGGTDNHLMLVDLSPIGITGDVIETRCDQVGIILNKNKIPGDKSALRPNGIRVGTAGITTRGALEEDMPLLAEIIYKIARNEQVEVSNFIALLNTRK